MPPPNFETKYKYAIAQKKFAWAKFYEQVNSDHNVVYQQVETFKTIVIDPLIPTHLKNQITDMMKELQKKYECPVCMDMIEPNDLDITSCGHFYCKGCLKTVLEGTDPKCPTCRRKLKSD
jgi:rubrerythrin